jgi:hypothetical protein
MTVMQTRERWKIDLRKVFACGKQKEVSGVEDSWRGLFARWQKSWHESQRYMEERRERRMP